MHGLPPLDHFWIMEELEADAPASAARAAELSAAITRLGLSPAHLAQNGLDLAADEVRRLAALGLPAPRFDERLPVFQQAALHAGAATAVCPWCGKAVATRESYCVFINSFDQPVFYRFACCGEFHLLAAKSPQVKQALWLPAQRALASFAAYRAFPHNHDYYGPDNFREWLKLFNSLQAREPDLAAAYRAAGGGGRTALALGFVGNFGHHISDELSALPFLGQGLAQPGLQLVIGPLDAFDLADAFPDCVGPAPLRVAGTGRDTPPELFRLALQQGLFVTRLSHTAPLQEAVAQRLQKAAARRCTPGFLARVAASRRSSPLAWVTLRSHNRSWRGQAQGLAQVLNALKADYPELGVVFDGMEAERPVLQETLAGLAPGMAAHDGLGTNLFEALTWASATDFFIAPLGNGTGFTSIANKPGVVHSHEEWAFREPFCINRRENCVLALPVTGQTLREPGRDQYTADYELDWREVLDAARLVCRDVPRRLTGKTPGD